MKGTIVAINRHLGAVVVETEEHKCVLLETLGRLNADIGDEIIGNWSEQGNTTVENVTRGDRMHMTLQDNNISRSEAVGRMSVI